MFFICVFALKNMKIEPKNPLCNGRVDPTFDDGGKPQHPIELLREMCGIKYDGHEYVVYGLKSQKQVCDANVYPVFVNGDPKHPNPFIDELCKVVYDRYGDIYTMHPRPL